MEIVTFDGPSTWDGVRWVIAIFCIIVEADKEPIMVMVDVTTDDIWCGRRIEFHYLARSKSCVIKRRLRLPRVSSFESYTHIFAGAGHSILGVPGDVIANISWTGIRSSTMPGAPARPIHLSKCHVPILPDDEFNLHLEIDVTLSVAFFGICLTLDKFIDVPSMSKNIPPVYIPPFSDSIDLVRVVVVHQAGLYKVDGTRGDMFIFARLSLPPISESTLRLQKPFLVRLLDTLQKIR